MTRPTVQDLAHAAGLLEALGYRHDSRNNPDGFPDVATLLDLLVWLDTELDAAKAAAVYGPGGPRSPEGGGTIGAHTIGHHGLGRPVEDRLDFGTDHEDPTRRARPISPRQVALADPLVRELQALRAGWRTELAQLVDSWRQRADAAANYHKTRQQTG